MKYFYTDPLKAAWMSEKHGVSFIYPDEDRKRGCIDSLRIEASISISGDNKLKYHLPYPLKTSFKRFIYPDCHEMLKAQEGDIGVYQDETCRYYEGKTGWLLLYGKSELGNNPAVKIIRRNGKAWFDPEVEG